jgi:hypothetical protein
MTAWSRASRDTTDAHRLRAESDRQQPLLLRAPSLQNERHVLLWVGPFDHLVLRHWSAVWREVL